MAANVLTHCRRYAFVADGAHPSIEVALTNHRQVVVAVFLAHPAIAIAGSPTDRRKSAAAALVLKPPAEPVAAQKHYQWLDRDAVRATELVKPLAEAAPSTGHRQNASWSPLYASRGLDLYHQSVDPATAAHLAVVIAQPEAAAAVVVAAVPRIRCLSIAAASARMRELDAETEVALVTDAVVH